MLQSLELFLIAAEELNFSKAAQRAYVTQQCLSDHIKRLEQQYGVPLFNRKPRISLTEHGKALQSAIQNMKIIEINLENDFREISDQQTGTLNFGINATRARVLLPEIYPQFHERFPKVNLNIRLGETRSMEALLLNGKLDLFLGIDTLIQPLLAARAICDNPLYCVLSESTLASVLNLQSLGAGLKTEYCQCPDNSSDEKLAFFRDCLTNGIDLALLQDLNFPLCLPESTTRQLIVNSLSRQNIYLSNTISISDYETHFELCAFNRMASICPSIAISQVVLRNQTLAPENHLYFFPIRNFKSSLKVHLVHHRDRHFTRYMNCFIDLLTEEIRRQEDLAGDYLARQLTLSPFCPDGRTNGGL